MDNKKDLFHPFPLGKFCLVKDLKTPVPTSWKDIVEIMKSREVLASKQKKKKTVSKRNGASLYKF